MDAEVKAEFTPHGAGPRQDHDKQPQGATATRHRDGTDMRPVDLSLLADERVEAQEGFAVWRWAHHRNEATQGALTPTKAAVADHVQNSRRAQARVSEKGLLDESFVGRHQERRPL